MPGFKDLLRSFMGRSSEDKAQPQEQISLKSVDKTPESKTSSSTEMLPEDFRPDLHASLRRLKEGTFSPDDIIILQKALAAKQIVVASRGGVGIGGDVLQSIIITGDGTTFTLTAEALKLLMPKKAIHIPYPRNMNFTGRESLLTDMRTALDSGSNVALTHVKALTGLGGIGKTQLALEYSYRYQDDYDIVWWLRSEQSFTLLDDYARMAWSLDLAGEDVRDLEFLAGKVKSFLETHSHWLLVFDNAQDPQDLKPYLPNCRGGHVIITSRNPIWGNLARTMEVSKFERSESVEFLLKRTGQEDRKAADDLAEALGDLPLALEQAGAYMDANKKPLDKYLKSFQERRLEILAKSKPSDYPDTVATTWDISFQAVGKDYPVARELLQLFSYLAPDDIPLSYIVKGSGHLPDNVASVLKDEDGRDEAMSALRRYSLVNISDDKISVHRLVQAVTRDDMSLQKQKGWTGSAVKLLNDVFPKDHIDNVRSWAECSILLPHALAAAEHAEELSVELEATGLLLNENGQYLRTLGEFGAARSALERALKICEKAYGKDHPNVATAANNIGTVLQDLGELEEARKYLERALEIDEKVYGPDHPNVAIDVNNIGGVLRDLGDFQEARKCYERALKIDEQVYGPDHPNAARVINNIGLVLQDLGEMQEARKYLERALEIDEKAYGKDHPNVARDINNIGLALQDLGNLQEARKCYERALEIDEQVYGPDHPTVARDINNLGGVLRDLGDFQEARKCYERALKIDEQVYGPDHPNAARDINNIGLVLQDLGEMQEARKYLERALEIDEKAYGKDHPNVARDINNIGLALQAQGDLQEARKCYEQALKIFRDKHGPDHPNTRTVANNLDLLRQGLE